MPRVGDLTKCKIYKITSLNNPELVYYGHTCDTLSRRFSKHKAPSNGATSKLIIDKGDAIILLFEEYPCENENQAKAREAFYILNNPCVNKNVPGRTLQEYRDSHKKQSQEYRDSHKENNKEYRNSHKAELKEYKRLYYLKNKAKK